MNGRCTLEHVFFFLTGNVLNGISLYKVAVVTGRALENLRKKRGS